MRNYLRTLKFLVGLVAMTLLTACGDADEVDNDTASSENNGPEILFTELAAATSGIQFANTLQEDALNNFFVYEYFYNGGGVASGDLNGDGLPELYFTGNQVADQLYLNQGALKFEDVTATALPSVTAGWSTGVTMADVNGDGWLDIYVCRSGHTNDEKALQNLLFINENGGMSFREAAAEFGLADSHHSTQAAFFDYDLDGDLDCYVMNHYTHFKEQGYQSGTEDSSDRFYRNDGGKFVDASAEVGIDNHACGLGLSVGDINDDGYPDLYVSNDFDEGDYFYINQQGKGFTNELTGRIKHTSNFGMGTDLADFNNDAKLDLVQMDMAYADHVRSKRNMASMSNEKFWGIVRAGHHFQYMSNTLQMNVGNHTFSEVAQLAGIAKTDWSWSPLLADFDNDGDKDLFITNGFHRDIMDRDFQNEIEARIATEKLIDISEVESMVDESVVQNKMFSNDSDLHFTDVTDAWGFTKSFNSNGASYADLDQDGDLDLVVNNIDEVASIYENHAAESANHWLQLTFPADADLGTNVILHASDGSTQRQEVMTTRGYQSAVTRTLHFGLGSNEIDHLEVHWPNGEKATYRDLAVNQRVKITPGGHVPNETSAAAPLMRDITEQVPFSYVQQENTFDDFEQQVLLPHRQSRQGPALASADLDQDGIEELFIGGAKGYPAQIIKMNANGTLQSWQPDLFNQHQEDENLGAQFFDANGDSFADLIVVNGGNESTSFKHRIYLNDGSGQLIYSPRSISNTCGSAKALAIADVDGDGDQDIFIGGRVVPGEYPKAPISNLLINEGNGFFRDEAETKAAGLSAAGMVTDAVFSDYDGDGDPDLITVGEWMSPMIWENNDGEFTDVTTSAGLDQLTGWWFSLAENDMDGDGDADYVVGNLGLNHKYKASAEKPLNIYGHDLDENGSWDMVLTTYQEDKHYPVRGRECSSEQVPNIVDNFPTYEAFATAEVENIYGSKLDEALHLTARQFQSGWIENKGDGTFTFHAFPRAVQIAPMQDIVFVDINEDGILDLVAAGNLYDAEVETVRHDAGFGWTAVADGKGGWQWLPTLSSGLFVPGNLQRFHTMKLGPQKWPVIVAGNNQGPLQFFHFQQK